MSEQEFFNRLASTWDDFRDVNFKILTELTQQMNIQGGESILDIGSGTGVFLPFLHQAIGSDGKITALDFSAAMLERAKEKYGEWENISFVVADIMDYQATDPFDKIVCLNFFPHVQDKTTFFRKIYVSLKPGGEFFILHDISRAAVNAVHEQSNVVHEDRLPAAEEVTKQLVRCGFTVKNTLDNDECYLIQARSRANN